MQFLLEGRAQSECTRLLDASPRGRTNEINIRPGTRLIAVAPGVQGIDSMFEEGE